MTKTEWQRRRRAERKAAGLCVHCGVPAASATMCERHLAETAAATYAYYETPDGQINRVQQRARKRRRDRASQGFQSTRAGRAAIAAYFTTRGGERG